MQCQLGNSLPIVYTLPGGKIAEAYIAKHAHKVHMQTKFFFLHEGKTKLSWDKNLIRDKFINQTQDEATVFIDMNQMLIFRPSTHTHDIPVQTTQTKGELELAICGDCTIQNPANGIITHSNQCSDCVVNLDNLS